MLLIFKFLAISITSYKPTLILSLSLIPKSNIPPFVLAKADTNFNQLLGFFVSTFSL